MKIGFQYMGNLHIAVKAFMNSVGCELVPGSQSDQKSLECGVRNSPEIVCFPFKVALGNLIQCLELGADTLIFLGNGTWPCRFGFYGKVQYDILKKLGYEFNSIFLDTGSLFGFVKKLVKLNEGKWIKTILKILYGARLAFLKYSMIKNVESWTRIFRPIEAKKGFTTRLCNHLITAIDNTTSLEILRILENEIENAFLDIQIDTNRDLFRVLIAGESCCITEPFANFSLIEHLGELGIVAHPVLTTQRKFFNKVPRREFDGFLSRKKAFSVTNPLFAYETCNEEQIYERFFIDALKRRFDGVIHVMPTSCMSENAILPVMIDISKKNSIPFLSLTFDEHCTVEGINTRLEAFVDLLIESRKKSRPELIFEISSPDNL